MTLLGKADNAFATTYAFLQALKVKSNYNNLKENLSNHPDYPSLLAVSEILATYKIDNYAADLTPEDLPEVPMPCLAALNTEGGIFALVNDVQNGLVDWWHSEKGLQQESITSFAQKWNGVLLLAQTNEASGEINYAQNRRKEFIESIFKAIPIFCGLTVFVIGLYLILSTFSFAIILLCLIKFSGFVISILLLWRLIDKNNPFVNSVCQVNFNVDCSTVLDSKAATIGGVLSWSEVGFFYFAGSLLNILASENNQEVFQNIAFLNFLALPYTFFSIYYQGIVLKKWCILCLGVQMLLWVEFIAFYWFNGFPILMPMEFRVYLIFITLFLLPIIIWFTLKPIMQAALDSTFFERGMKAFQNDASVFHALLKQKEQVKNVFSTNELIIFGNPQAINSIMVTTNPYCSHCADSHLLLNQIITENPQTLKLQIVFVASNATKDKSKIFVNHLFSLNSQVQNEALDYWFEKGNKDFEEWSKIFPISQLNKSAMQIAEKHIDWCLNNNIQETPTFFINGYYLPKVYQIEDIKRIASRIFT